jgi:phospholipase C
MAGATNSFPPVLRRALAIAPRRTHGSIRDVEHIVVLTQENRSFDHYFGTLRGVRGFGDPFPIPVADTAARIKRSVWTQSVAEGAEVLQPFHLDTARDFRTMRIAGTPHYFTDAQDAWSHGKLDAWPMHKTERSMGYYRQQDLPFQFALAEAFTICDAYHCSFHGGTNPNRLFLWTGSNDPLAEGGGPITTNEYDNLDHDPSGGYTFATYAERLERAGVSWRVYQDMADNFTDNPLAGFRRFRQAYRGAVDAQTSLLERGLSTRTLDQLRDDVLQGELPQVSWIVATASGSEHPGPSSPAQGAEYTAQVLEALTADPDVWSKTALFVNFDENDGFFDHMPPPAPPSGTRGASTVDTTGEYHRILPTRAGTEQTRHLGTPYGLGPRVPMYVVSPWTRGGWVCSEVFDHTSVIRFMEARFGVVEPNISQWRRAVCGDMTSAFDFSGAAASDFPDLPETTALAHRARSLTDTVSVQPPSVLTLPVQDRGVRPLRAMPYALEVGCATADAEHLNVSFRNDGLRAAVFHVYDRHNLALPPYRFTVDCKLTFKTALPVLHSGNYDVWMLGPGGMHAHFCGAHGDSAAEVEARSQRDSGSLTLHLRNRGAHPVAFRIVSLAHLRMPPIDVVVPADGALARSFDLQSSAHWFDFAVVQLDSKEFVRRFAGHVETGRPSISDPTFGTTTAVAQLDVRALVAEAHRHTAR